MWQNNKLCINGCSGQMEGMKPVSYTHLAFSRATNENGGNGPTLCGTLG